MWNREQCFPVPWKCSVEVLVWNSFKIKACICVGHLRLKLIFPPKKLKTISIKLFFSINVLCLVIQSCPTLWDPMDYSLPGSSVHGDSPRKNAGGLPCPPPGDLPNPRIKPRSPTLQVDSFFFSFFKSRVFIVSLKDQNWVHRTICYLVSAAGSLRFYSSACWTVPFSET